MSNDRVGAVNHAVKPFAADEKAWFAGPQLAPGTECHHGKNDSLDQIDRTRQQTDSHQRGTCDLRQIYHSNSRSRESTRSGERKISGRAGKCQPGHAIDHCHRGRSDSRYRNGAMKRGKRATARLKNDLKSDIQVLQNISADAALPCCAGSLWRGVARALVPLERWGPRARRTCLFSIDRGEQLFHGTRRRRAEALVEVDRLRELLPDEFVALREFDILCERPLNTLGVTTIQIPGCVPWQQGLDLVALSL